jgi:hypothetical protein
VDVLHLPESRVRKFSFQIHGKLFWTASDLWKMVCVNTIES